MSCHNICRGMNYVVKNVIKMYDTGELTLEAARKIIAAARRGVNWCDGNEYEAVEIIRRCRCGRCLKKMEAGAPLYSVWDVPVDSPGYSRILDTEPEILASEGLCSSCFDIVINRFLGDENAGQRERKYIEEHRSEKEWKANEWREE